MTAVAISLLLIFALEVKERAIDGSDHCSEVGQGVACKL